MMCWGKIVEVILMIVLAAVATWALVRFLCSDAPDDGAAGY